MSVIIALKYNKGIILGADSQITNNHIKINNVTKIHESKYSNTAIGTAGSLRVLNLIKSIDDLMDYKDILDKVELNEKYIVTNIIPKLTNMLEKSGCLYKENNIISTDNEFLIISNKKIFNIGFDFSVLEFDKYASIGSGYELVVGYLDTLNYIPEKTNLDEAIKILETAIKKSCKNEIYINDGIDYINLES